MAREIRCQEEQRGAIRNKPEPDSSPEVRLARQFHGNRPTPQSKGGCFETIFSQAAKSATADEIPLGSWLEI